MQDAEITASIAESTDRGAEIRLSVGDVRARVAEIRHSVVVYVRGQRWGQRYSK